MEVFLSSFFDPLFRPIPPKIVADESVPEGTVMLIGPQLRINRITNTSGHVVAEWWEGLDGCAVIKNVGKP